MQESRETETERESGLEGEEFAKIMWARSIVGSCRFDGAE